jgi:hypothetical protein
MLRTCRDIIVESGDTLTITIMPCEVFAQLTRLQHIPQTKSVHRKQNYTE